MTELKREPDKDAVIVYTNWRGVTETRRIQPLQLSFGTTEWHPEPQWLLRALDVDKDMIRSFALAGIKRWGV